MRDFKEGAAHLAIKAGVPVAPIGLVGTRAVLPMDSVIVRPGKIVLRVGDVIETAAMKSHDRAELNQRLRDEVVKLLG